MTRIHIYNMSKRTRERYKRVREKERDTDGEKELSIKFLRDTEVFVERETLIV